MVEGKYWIFKILKKKVRKKIEKNEFNWKCKFNDLIWFKEADQKELIPYRNKSELVTLDIRFKKTFYSVFRTCFKPILYTFQI